MQPESQATLEKGKNNAQKKVKKIVSPHNIWLFCENKTTTSGRKIFKSNETFTSWGHKKSRWTNVEQTTRDLQMIGIVVYFLK